MSSKELPTSGLFQLWFCQYEQIVNKHHASLVIFLKCLVEWFMLYKKFTMARQSIDRTFALGLTSKRFLDWTIFSRHSCIFLLTLIYYPTYILDQILLFSNTHSMYYPIIYMHIKWKHFFPISCSIPTHPWRNCLETDTLYLTIEKNLDEISDIYGVLHGDRRAKFGSIIIWLNFIYTLDDIVPQCIRSRCKGNDLISFKQMFF